jgi:hypothetical protein
MQSSLVDFYRARIAQRMQIHIQQRPCAIVTSREQCDRIATMFNNALAYSTQRTKVAGSSFVANVNMMHMLIHGPSKLSDYEAGMKMMEQIETDINNFKRPPKPFQMRVIHLWTMLIAPVIFRSAYRTHIGELRQRYKWDRSHFGVGIVTSARKDGKSSALAYIVALLLFNFPSAVYNIFASTLLQSKIILDFAKGAIAGHPRAHHFKIHMAERTIRMRAADDDERVAIAHSGSLEVYLFFVCSVFIFLRRRLSFYRKTKKIKRYVRTFTV